MQTKNPEGWGQIASQILMTESIIFPVGFSMGVKFSLSP